MGKNRSEFQTAPALAQLRDPIGVLEGGQTQVPLTRILWLQGNMSAGNPSMSRDELPHICDEASAAPQLLSDQCPMHLSSACILVSEMKLRSPESEKQGNGRVCRDGESQLGGLL